MVCQCLKQCAELIPTSQREWRAREGPEKTIEDGSQPVSVISLFAIEKRWLTTEIADVLYCHEWGGGEEEHGVILHGSYVK